MKNVVDGVYEIGLGMVNTFLIDQGGLTLIDTGIAGSDKKILQAVQELGRKPQDIQAILITHLHGDHCGSLAAVQQATGAEVYMHASDAASVRQGIAMRSFEPGPGFMNRLIVGAMGSMRQTAKIEPAEVQHEIQDGDVLPLADGIQVLHLPGHTAGHTCFLWPQQGGVLFVGDAAGNMFNRLNYSILYEDLPQGEMSLSRLAGLNFETACFGHGGAIIGGAATHFQRRWGA